MAAIQLGALGAQGLGLGEQGKHLGKHDRGALGDLCDCFFRFGLVKRDQGVRKLIFPFFYPFFYSPLNAHS